MALKSRLKDWRRRRLLRRHGIGVEVQRPTFAAGARSGVWFVCEQGLGPDSVVYSFGLGDNVAWELAVIERFGARVHGFDPTPRALAYLGELDLPDRFVVHPTGLAAFDGEMEFAAPAKERDVNYRPGRGPGIRAPVRRLATLAAELGHERIDVLKVDIEGGEYDALPDVLAAPVEVSQILIEFHHGQDGIPFTRTREALGLLAKAGYRIFHVSRRGLEFGLLLTA